MFSFCSGFTASAVDLLNMNNIEIENCVFDNCSTNVGKDQYRGNSGAVSIAFLSTEGEDLAVANTTLPFTLITNSVFTNNKAILPPEQSTAQINQALNNNIYFGRGGSVGIFVQESSLRNISFLIQGCLFDGNFAESFGGGLYLYVAGSNTNHTFTVENSTFTRNVAGKGSFGGGLQVAMLIQNLDRPPTRFDFIGCHFEENVADYGGGLSTVQVSRYLYCSVHASHDLLMYISGV